MHTACLSTRTRSLAWPLAATLAWSSAFATLNPAQARAEAPPAEMVKSIVDAVGGEAKLLRLFRFKEMLALGSDPAKAGSARTSVVQPPEHWWLGKRDRVTQDKEPAVFLVYGWTLGALVDPKSTLEALPEKEVEGKAATGIRIGGTVTPAMDLYFDKGTKRLAAIEWRADRHVFSDWREVDGCSYPSKCVGYKVKDGKRWYHTEIVEIERLSEVPPENKSP